MTFRAQKTLQACNIFWGMLNFYHRFVPHAAETLQPLYAALKGTLALKVDWTPVRIAAFDAAKTALADICLFYYKIV